MASYLKESESSKTRVLLADENGRKSRFYEFYPPGAINDHADLPENPCTSVLKNDAADKSVYDLQRHRMTLKHLRKLLLQVSTLVKFGIRHLHFAPQETVQVAINQAKKELLKDGESLLKQLVEEQATLSGSHDNIIANETNFSLAKTTILDLIENSEKDIIEELEFGDLDLISNDDEVESTTADLFRLQKCINVRIEKKAAEIMSMETENWKGTSNDGGDSGEDSDSNSLDIFMSYL